MTLKLGLIRELGFVLAAYVLARIRFVVRRIASLSGADHRSVSVAALLVGVLAGVGGAQWTASEIPKTSEFAKASTSVGISNDRSVYELAVEDLDTSSFAKNSVTPETFDVRVGRRDAAASILDDHSEKPLNPGIQESRLLPSTHAAPAAPLPSSGPPAWRRYALATDLLVQGPMVAIVIDDLGVHVRNAARTIALPGPLTLSFMSYAQNLRAQTETARAAGHELMLHLPMEPQDRTEDPGPNVLLTRLTVEENLRRLRWALGRFEGYIGVNNHMGSRFTQDEEGMTLVMNELNSRGLMFLDSRTAHGSVSEPLARRYGVPFVGRDVFLDNVPIAADVRARLDELEAIARHYGRAVGIAHPHKGSIEALEAWLPSLEARGITLVPLSAFLLQLPGSS